MKELLKTYLQNPHIQALPVVATYAQRALHDPQRQHDQKAGREMAVEVTL